MYFKNSQYFLTDAGLKHKLLLLIFSSPFFFPPKIAEFYTAVL